MKKTVSNILIFSLTCFVFLIVFISPSIFIPVSEEILKRLNPEEMNLFFPLLLLLAIYISITYLLLIRSSELSKKSLLVKLVTANFILFPLMGLLEMFFWGDAFKGIETSEFIKIFFRFVITFSVFSVYLMLIHKPNLELSTQSDTSESFKQLMYKIITISLIYFIIYNFFGYFVAWQFEETRIFYTGSADIKDFFSAMFQNISDPVFVLVHLFRGVLFGIAGYLFHSILSCSRKKELLIMSLLFGGFGFQIILPNPMFPEMVRISHFLETTSSMLVFGFLVGYVLSNKDLFSNK